VATIVLEQFGSVSGLNAVARKLVGSPTTAEEALSALPASVAQALKDAEKSLTSTSPVERLRVYAGEKTFGLFVMRMNDGAIAWAIEDITEAEDMQAELARTQRLAEIGQMTAAIAHDIRNPLTTLIGAGRMIQRDPEMAPEFGKMVEDEANRLNELCNEFLAFAKPMSIRLEPVDLGELGMRVVSRHQTASTHPEVKLTIDAPPNLPTIQADRGRIEQVLHNLISNAIQACEEGGEVRLIVTADGFRVEDTGKGIDESAMKRLFTPFFTTRARGTGLGLCNVKRILDAQGGRIDVYPLDPGTCFDVTLGGKAA
jgi:signal transduction histidine kinase